MSILLFHARASKKLACLIRDSDRGIAAWLFRLRTAGDHAGVVHVAIIPVWGVLALVTLSPLESRALLAGASETLLFHI
jgi:hypothetical protein